MPLYSFQASDGEAISVVMDTKQPPESYRVQYKNGKSYKRVYDAPRISIDSRPGVSESDFTRATSGKKMTIGQMQDLSKEMHEKRAEKEGQDPVKEKFYQNYEKQMGQKHSNVIKKQTETMRAKRAAKAKEKLRRHGVEITL